MSQCFTRIMHARASPTQRPALYDNIANHTSISFGPISINKHGL